MPIEKRWVVKPQGDSEAVAKLAAVLRISPVLANLLVQRGIDTVEKADKFFKPSLADLHDPFLMKDMDKAVERVERAVRNNEKIMVYGDYDVDGCTAVALVYKFLRQIGHKNLMFYIPDRYTEGYGISVKGIDLAARDHNRSDTRFPTFVNCCLYLRTHRINHAAQSQKAKLLLQQIRILAFRFFRPKDKCRRQSPRWTAKSISLPKISLLTNHFVNSHTNVL